MVGSERKLLIWVLSFSLLFVSCLWGTGMAQILAVSFAGQYPGKLLHCRKALATKEEAHRGSKHTMQNELWSLVQLRHDLTSYFISFCMI